MNGKRKDELVGAIEAGGTKIVCAVGTGPKDLDRTEFPTGNKPAQILAEVSQWLRERQAQRGKLLAVGIGSFGPIDLDKDSPRYGHITSTPKPGWRDTDVVGAVRQVFPDIPIGFDTDVNAAALGENYWGNGVGLEDLIYITIGTGIGGGGMVGGQLLHGLVHPEMGHMQLPRLSGDSFEGVCPYHGACWEGLCSGPALKTRAGIPLEELTPEHEIWPIAAHYTAYAIANIICVLSPQRLIIGGSVRKGGRLGSDRFFQLIREKVQMVLKGYIRSPALSEGISNYIVPPLLGDDAGICGAIALAQVAVA